MGQQESIQEIITFRVPSRAIDKQTIKSLTDSTLGYVDLSRGKWRKMLLTNVMPKIQQWRVRKGIVLDDNNYPGIVREISNIKFPFLVELALRKNNIQSLEGFCRIDMPNLERLWFCDNKICFVSAIRKTNFPKLRYLSFNLNEPNDISKFSQHDSPYLQELFILFQLTKGDFLKEIIKFRTKNLTKIYTQKQLSNWPTKLKKKYQYLSFREQACFLSVA